MRGKAAALCILLLGGLAIQPAPAFADARDLLNHLSRQEQQRQDRDSRFEEDREQRQDDRHDRRDEERHPRHRQRMGSGEAARRAQARNGGGRVLDVDALEQGYRVKLLKQGEVRTLMIPEGE